MLVGNCLVKRDIDTRRSLEFKFFFLLIKGVLLSFDDAAVSYLEIDAHCFIYSILGSDGSGVNCIGNLTLISRALLLH